MRVAEFHCLWKGYLSMGKWRIEKLIKKNYLEKEMYQFPSPVKQKETKNDVAARVLV